MTALGGRVLDVPALVDAATGRSEYMRALLAVMTRLNHTIAVPSSVRARAAEQLTTATELAELDWFFQGGGDRGTVLEIALHSAEAAEVDSLAKDHFHGEIAAAHAARTALGRGWALITTEDRAPMFQATGVTVELLP